jgi:ABC-type nitrate/sulfonate/bicarbonate transport system substrate-binding protein
MGRVINTDSTGKSRNQHMRTCAEMLRHLSQKQALDAEAKDMVAALVYALREIDSGIEQSAQSWEKRDYWMKAEELRQRWGWPGRYADALTALVLGERWEELPPLMVKLMPYFSDIKITKFTRDMTSWSGCHMRLLGEKSAQ